MSLKVHPKRDAVMSNGTSLISSVLNRLVSPSRKEETLFKLYFVLSLLCQVFICFSVSHSHRLMADMTFHNIAGGAVLYLLLKVIICDKDFKQNNLCRFPYQEGTVEKWFKEKVMSKTRKTGTINMLNLRKRSETAKYTRNGKVFLPPEEEAEVSTILSHGTTHDNAKSILEGIKLTESEVNGDFSNGRGFYLTNQFERAVDYAFSKSAKAAVLVFKIPNAVLERFRRTSINLVGEENKGKWQNVVEAITKRNRLSSFIEEPDHNNNLSFIEGPEMKRKFGGGKTSEQLPDSHQMCIRDEDMAEQFDAHLDSVVFYNTSGTGKKKKRKSKEEVAKKK